MCEQFLPFYWWLLPAQVWADGWATAWRTAWYGNQQWLKCVQRNYHRSMQLKKPEKNSAVLLNPRMFAGYRLLPETR